MNNEFTQVMSERTNEALIKIVTSDRDKYQAPALAAADLEIEKRAIDTSTFERIRQEAMLKKKQVKRVDTKQVGPFVRFAHYFIDLVISYILTYIVFTIVALFFNEVSNNAAITLISFIIVFGTFFSYYALMEIKFQKTIAKFITNTKVVTLQGHKPSNADIIARTFCRFIPFDGISYLFVRNGLHDYLSKTKVVKD